MKGSYDYSGFTDAGTEVLMHQESGRGSATGGHRADRWRKWILTPPSQHIHKNELEVHLRPKWRS